MLQAIADGRVELLCGRVPSLAVDGLWCDFAATGQMFAEGLFRPARPAAVGMQAPAELTTSGLRVLSSFA